jgi:hypothetical protein
MDLLDCRHSRPLPLELNCEIFKCLDLLIQRDFISGLGREIYDMFGQKLHIKLIKVLREQICKLLFAQSTNAFGKIVVYVYRTI